MIRKGFLAGAAAWLALTGVAVQAQSVLPKAPAGRECITSSEAQGLALVLAPMAMREVVRFCGPKLPATAYFNHSDALIAKLQAASTRAAPGARGAIAKLLGGTSDVTVDLIMPALDTVMAPMLAKELKAAECPTYDHIASLLDPMPAENTAELLITIAQLAQKDKQDPKFPICSLPKAN